MGVLFRALGNAQVRLSHQPFAVWCAVKTRNQCNAIIGRALGATVIDHRMNGEEKLAAALHGQLRYFVDVGANCGSWTAMFLRHQPVVAGGLLFEPSMSAIKELLPRFVGTSQLHVIAAAAGDVAGEIAFYEEASAGQTSSVVANHSAMPAVQRTVPVTTVSAEVSARNWPEVDFLKIDAEGYDFHVLRGAQELLAARKVRIGQFEYGPGWRHAGSTLTHALKYLQGFDFSCFLLTREGLTVPKPDWYGEYFEYSNYVFVRADARVLLAELIRE